MPLRPLGNRCKGGVLRSCDGGKCAGMVCSGGCCFVAVKLAYTLLLCLVTTVKSSGKTVLVR